MRSRSVFAGVVLLAAAAAVATYGQTAETKTTANGAASTLSDGAQWARAAAAELTLLDETARSGDRLKNDFLLTGTPAPNEWQGFLAEVDIVRAEVARVAGDMAGVSAYRSDPPVGRYLVSEAYRDTAKEVTALRAKWERYDHAVRNADGWIEGINEREWVRSGCSACAPGVPRADIARRAGVEGELLAELLTPPGASSGSLLAFEKTLMTIAHELTAASARVTPGEAKAAASPRRGAATRLGTMIGIGGFTVAKPGAHR